MSIVKVAAFSISMDGFGAGPNQDLNNPLGLRGVELHSWIYPTKMFHDMTGQPGGTEGIDHQVAASAMKNLGAWILGRNMFGPVRGPWLDDEWKGWWGDEPPYHTPVFVLTHHKRPPLEMKGNTVFHFVTGGIHEALQRAREAAGEKDIRIGGGTQTVRQYIEADCIDELQFSISPVVLGKGENLFAGLDLHAKGFRTVKSVSGEGALHVYLKKQ